MSTSAPSKTQDNSPSSEESTDDCGFSPVSSTDDEAPNGFCSPAHGFTASSEDSSNEYLALRSDDHVGLDGRASSTATVMMLPDSYAERSKCQNMPREVPAPQCTKADHTNTGSSTGDNSHSWCHLDLERLTNTISNGAEHKGTIADLRTLDGELRRNNTNSSLLSDPNDSQEASRATINGSYFSAASGNCVQMDNLVDIAAPRGTTGGAETIGNFKSCWSERIHESAFIQPPLLSTMHADIPNVIIRRDDKKQSGTSNFRVVSATCAKENRKSRSNVPNCSASTTHASAQLPARSSAENFLKPEIAALWEQQAFVKTGADNFQRYDLRKDLNLRSCYQENHAWLAPTVEGLYAHPSSKRKNSQSPEPGRNKRTRSSSINKDVTGLPTADPDRKKAKDTTKVQDVPRNQQMRVRSNSAVTDEEMSTTHQFDDTSQAPMRPSATETAHREASCSRTADRRTPKETRATSDATMDEHPAIPMCILQQYDDFYAGVSDVDPRMLSGWKPDERLGMGKFFGVPKSFSRPAQD